MSALDRRQEKRWSTIQANVRRIVKETPSAPVAQIRAQVAFPILAVAPSRRHAGIVCLDGRLQTVVGRMRRLRDGGSADEIIRTLVTEFSFELTARRPGLVVVECDFTERHDPLTEVLAESLVRCAHESGVRVVAMSFADACARVSEDGSARATATVLLRRYDELAKRLAPQGVPLLRNDRWREAKPLVVAFALAHAVALEILTSAIRPHGLGQPPQ